MSLLEKMREQYARGEEISNVVKLPNQDTKTFVTPKSYNRIVDMTAIYPDRGKDLGYPVLGLVSEVGEIAGKLKKIVRDQGGSLNVDDLTPEQRWQLIEELCDTVWYTADIALTLGVTIVDLMSINAAKLLDRLERKALGGSGDHR